MSQKWLILLAFVFAAYLAAQTSNQNNFGGGSALPTNLTFVAPTLTVSAATFGNGSLALSGNTSGTCTQTTSATSTTILDSCTTQGPDGTAANPTFHPTTQANTGIYYNLGLTFASGGSDVFATGGAANGFAKVASNGVFQFASGGVAATSGDTGLSRSAADVLAIGSGTSGDTSARVKAAGYMSVGTTFTSNAGCSETSLAGGATAGKFNAGAVSCTLIVTMGNSATAPNGWACKANDLTTTADTMMQTATAATTATFSGTVVSGDVINFSCIGY